MKYLMLARFGDHGGFPLLVILIVALGIVIIFSGKGGKK